MPLKSTGEAASYLCSLHSLAFWMLNGEEKVMCQVSCAALDHAYPPPLEDHFVRFEWLRQDIAKIASRLFDQGHSEPIVATRHLSHGAHT